MDIFQEITSLRTSDIFTILDTHNPGFSHPIHRHSDYEINLIMGISGTRMVGDSTERFTDFDLVLLGPYLYHKWEGDDPAPNIRHSYRIIRIQFGMDLFGEHFFLKGIFQKIRKLMQDSCIGIRFYGKAIEDAKVLMIRITESTGFVNVISFLQLLDMLSESAEKCQLSSEGFSSKGQGEETQRIQLACGYMLKNFSRSELKMGEVAAQIHMNESAFRHFFRKKMHRSFTEFLVDIRIGRACKLLLDTDDTVGQICCESGFNNLANFNRLFKKYRTNTPVQYRKLHLGKTGIDLNTAMIGTSSLVHV